MFTCRDVYENILSATAVRLLVWYLSWFASVAHSNPFSGPGNSNKFSFRNLFYFFDHFSLSLSLAFSLFLSFFLSLIFQLFHRISFHLDSRLRWRYPECMLCGFSSNICHTVVGLSFWHFTHFCHFCLSVRQMANRSGYSIHVIRMVQSIWFDGSNLYFSEFAVVVCQPNAKW